MDDAADDEQTWRIGQLADATGLSVRTLRHYDAIGLLTPSWRNQAGHRRYVAADLRRLHHALALRGFGLSLASVRQILDDAGPDPRALLRRQLGRIEERIEAAQQTRRTLLRVLGVLDLTAEPSVAQLVELIEVMTAMEGSLTPQQRKELAESRRRHLLELSAEQIEEMSQHRAQIMNRLSPDELAELQRSRRA